MRIALLSDIHANAEGLRAVLEDAHSRGVDEVWVLGDVVGYGPHVVEVVQLLRDLEATSTTLRMIAGNHDVYFLKCRVPHDLSYPVKRALLLNQWDLEMEPELLAWYEKRLLGNARDQCSETEWWQEDETLWILSHGAIACRDSILRPGADVYYPMCWEPDFLEHFYYPLLQCTQEEAPSQWLVLTGHTHIPSMVTVALRENARFPKREERLLSYGQPLPLFMEETRLTIVNPGSVGQPRDGDKRASYAILDRERQEVTFYRVSYDVEKVLQDMRVADYPEEARRRLREAPVLRYGRMITSPRGRKYKAILEQRRTGL